MLAGLSSMRATAACRCTINQSRSSTKFEIPSDYSWREVQGDEGLIEEGREMIEEDAEDEVRHAGLIAAAQRVEQYEIAGYGCARTYAELLGDRDGAKLLQQTLDEEGATDKKLTELAKTLINFRAQSV
jgi:ferritin-like metal-binding protein YciE